MVFTGKGRKIVIPGACPQFSRNFLFRPQELFPSNPRRLDHFLLSAALMILETYINGSAWLLGFAMS